MSRTWSQIAISLTRCLSSFGGIWCITLTKKHINFVRVFILDSWLESWKEIKHSVLSTAVLSAAFLSQLPLLRPLDLPLTSWFRNCNWTLNFRLCSWEGECSITKTTPSWQSYFNSKQVTRAFIWFADLCSYFVCKYSIATIFIQIKLMIQSSTRNSPIQIFDQNWPQKQFQSICQVFPSCCMHN